MDGVLDAVRLDMDRLDLRWMEDIQISHDTMTIAALMLVFVWSLILLAVGCRDQDRAEHVRSWARRSYRSMAQNMRRLDASLSLSDTFLRHRIKASMV